MLISIYLSINKVKKISLILRFIKALYTSPKTIIDINQPDSAVCQNISQENRQW